MLPLLMPKSIPAVGIMGRSAPVSRGNRSTLAVEKTGAAMDWWGHRVAHSYLAACQRETGRTIRPGAEARRARQFPRDPPHAELGD